jgi:exosortase/archaeosortase family protein
MASVLNPLTDSCEPDERWLHQRRFLVRAVVLMLLLYGVYYYPYAEGSALYNAIRAYLAFLTRLVGLSLSALGEAIRVEGTQVSLDAQALYVAAVLAFPAKAFAKMRGLVFGIAVLTLLNVLRIVALFYVGLLAQGAFERIHEELMPLLLVAAACLLFLTWTRWVQRHGA